MGLYHSPWPGVVPCGNSGRTLRQQECCLDVFSNLKSNGKLYIRNSQCVECDFSFESPTLEPEKITSFTLSSKYPLELYVDISNNKICNQTFSCGNLGKYLMNITKDSCEIEVTNSPESTLLNFGIIFSVFIGVFLLYGLYKLLSKVQCCQSVRNHNQFHELETDLGTPNAGDQNKSSAQARAKRQSRLASVDAFRGIAVVLMIFVNYGGGGYSFLKHHPWNGLYIADFVFPWFIWVMGMSIAFSLRSKLRNCISRKKILIQIMKRSCLLFVLGFLLNSRKGRAATVDTFKYIRVSGILQRISVTYFFVALTELLFMKPQRNEQYGPWNIFADVIDSLIQWVIVAVCIACHLLITFLLPVPGCPTGYLGPGGMHQHSMYEHCTGGAAGYIDRIVMTEDHMYSNPTCRDIYQNKLAFDPEGILGTFTSIFCAFLGVQAGRIILTYENTCSRIKRWLIWSSLLGIIGGVLCNFTQNNGAIPVNKNLFSLSFICITSSTAFILFTVLYWLIDYCRVYGGFPFVYAGMNPIIIYLGHELLRYYLPWHWKLISRTHFEQLSMNVSATCIWLAIAYVMYKSNIFISL